MILPTLRESFGQVEARQLVDLLGRHDEEVHAAARARLERHGLDALLDDPRILNALLTDAEVRVSPVLVFYVLVRHTLLEGGVDDRSTADYVASLVYAFGQGTRAYRISDHDDAEYHYLVDMITDLRTADSRRAFLLRVHLGNYALWLTGLFPAFLEARKRRKGAPPFEYYEHLGANGFREAAEASQAEQLGLGGLLHVMARRFSEVRVALNRISDRYMHLRPATIG